jgi:probable HAF family extracellular repeat protein
MTEKECCEGVGLFLNWASTPCIPNHQETRMLNPRHVRLARWSLVMTLLAAGQSHAQSSYALTTLKPPSGGLNRYAHGYQQRSFGIDSADQVVGPAGYAAGVYLDVNGWTFKTRYDQYVVKWPASSAASVSPVKVIRAPDKNSLLLDVSTGAKKVMVYSSGQAILDVATARLGPKVPTTIDLKQVNDLGVAVWWARDTGSSDQGTWSATTGTVTLAPAAGVVAGGRALNTQGLVVGTVTPPGARTHRAGQWLNGQWNVIDLRGGDVASEAIAVNEQGQALVQSHSVTCPDPSYCLTVDTSIGVITDGSFRQIGGGAGEPAATWLEATAINNQGVVVGHVRTSESQLTPARAFVWQNGVYSDLTRLVATKGLTLPAGAVLTDALALNDKGSIVAVMQTGSTQALVRLTARP